MSGSDFTTESARDQLDRASRADLASAADRRVYGLYVALIGVIVGGYVAVTRLVDGGSGSPYVLVGYAALLVAVTVWQSRAARAIPRGAKRKGLFALVGTVVLMIAAITTLNVVEIEVGLQWWHLALGGLVVALPSVVTGVLIARGGAR